MGWGANGARAPSAAREGDPSLVDCMVVLWWLYGGCAVVLKVSSPARRLVDLPEPLQHRHREVVCGAGGELRCLLNGTEVVCGAGGELRCLLNGTFERRLESAGSAPGGALLFILSLEVSPTELRRPPRPQFQSVLPGKHLPYKTKYGMWMQAVRAARAAARSRS